VAKTSFESAITIRQGGFQVSSNRKSGGDAGNDLETNLRLAKGGYFFARDRR
jgi:hypothetical protein